MKLATSTGLGNSVYKPKPITYVPDGSGRDIHCFTNARPVDTKDFDLGRLVTSLRDNNGRNKSPTVPQK